jgi:hypothetical protein
LRIAIVRLVCAVVVISGVGVFCGRCFAEPQQAKQVLIASCAVDNEITAKDRSAIDQAAAKFVEDLTGNPAAAYATLTADAKKKMSVEKFTVMAHDHIEAAGPVKNLHVTHAYLVKIASKGEQQAVTCGDAAKPEQSVNVVAKAIPRQAYALVEGQTASESRVFTLWLIPEQAHWQVQDFQLGAISLAGKSANDLWSLARQEQQRHHDLNAYMLYATALQLAARGPDLQLGIAPEIRSELQKAQRPKDLKEQAGFNWESDPSAFKIVSMGPIESDGKMYLRIGHELPPWTDDKETDQKNRALAAAFYKLYPECRDVFAGLAVDAHERGGTHSYRTLIPN